MKQNKDVYVIQRKDGMFYYDWVFDKGVSKPRFTRKIEHCFHNKQFGTENWAKTEIRCSELEDCKPVKVEINVVKDKKQELERFITGIKIDFSKEDNNYFEDEYDADINPNILIISLLETINDICKDNNFNSSDILKQYIEMGSIDLFNPQEEKTKIKKLQSNYFSNRDQQIKLLTERWEKLKDWVLNMRPLIRGSNTIFTKGALVDKIFELEKENKNDK